METTDSLQDETDNEEHAGVVVVVVDGADDEDDTVDGVPRHHPVVSLERP